jgi:hypothetical protein
LEDSATFALAHRKMPELLALIEQRRQRIDCAHYPAQQQGYRFPQGNSYIEKTTLRGVPIKIMLHFSTRENNFDRQSPTAICPSNIGELSTCLKRALPPLIEFDDTISQLINGSSVQMPVGCPRVPAPLSVLSQ